MAGATIATLTALGAAGLVFLACLGLGAAILRALRLLPALGPAEAVTWSFATGLGGLGWVLFFPGIAGLFDRTALLAVCAVCATGVVLLRRPAGAAGRAAAGAAPGPGPGTVTWLLWAAILVALAFDLVEALAPPTDADSLAYHFALPKQFLAEGRIAFVPRANTGAVPLLLHMTYVAALGLGGEQGLTLWTAISGWMAAALAQTLARRVLSRDWSLAVALLVLTTPAMLYGAGTGQVEARLALFALAGAFAAAEAVRGDSLRLAALAGMLAGFYAGGKYLGLLFAAAAGIAVLCGRGWWRRGLVFGVAMLAAGSQWYVWNWVHTGDPVFPVLYAALGLPDGPIWNRAHDALYRFAYFTAENPVPRNPWTFLAYPFRAALGYPAEIEAGRTGFGPLPPLILPFVLAGLWRFRRRLVASRLALPALIALLFYALWFWSGTSQRLRHLLPVYPLVLIAAMAVAARWAEATGTGRILAAAVGLALAVQMAGQVVYGANPLRYLVGGEGRSAYLERNTGFYAPVAWANARLGPGDRLLVDRNNIVYLLDVPYYYAHPIVQALVDVSPQARDPERFLRQTAAEGITHVLVPDGVDPDTGRVTPPDGWTGGLRVLVDALQRQGCARLLATFSVRRLASRTLASVGIDDGAPGRAGLFVLDRARCPVAGGGAHSG